MAPTLLSQFYGDAQVDLPLLSSHNAERSASARDSFRSISCFNRIVACLQVFQRYASDHEPASKLQAFDSIVYP